MTVGSSPFRQPSSWELALLFAAVTAQAQTDPLPSWNDGAAKQAIVAFVKATTTQGSPKFVPPEERIATFDQDGTLWVEHPMYTQVMYVLERVPALVKAKPELAKVAPYSTVLGVLKGDRAAIAKLTMADLMKLLAATLDRHVGRDLPGRGEEVARRGEGPALEEAVHRTDLPADAGSAEVPARQRLQDLHRHRRRPGLRARCTPRPSTAFRPSRWSAPPAARPTATPRTASPS